MLFHAAAARLQIYHGDCNTIERPPTASEGRKGRETMFGHNRDINYDGEMGILSGGTRRARAATGAERGLDSFRAWFVAERRVVPRISRV